MKDTIIKQETYDLIKSATEDLFQGLLDGDVEYDELDELEEKAIFDEMYEIAICVREVRKAYDKLINHLIETK